MQPRSRKERPWWGVGTFLSKPSNQQMTSTTQDDHAKWFLVIFEATQGVTLIFTFLLISTAFLGVLKTQQGAWFIAPTTSYIDCIYLLHAIEKEKGRIGGNPKSNMEKPKKQTKSFRLNIFTPMNWDGLVLSPDGLYCIYCLFIYLFFFVSWSCSDTVLVYNWDVMLYLGRIHSTAIWPTVDVIAA